MSHFISLEKAIELTQRYRAQKESLLVPAHQNQNVLPLSETFNRAAIDQLLAQPGCTGLRIYYGLDDALLLHAVLVGVDAENNDLLTPVALTAGEGDGPVIIDNSIRCPPICPSGSPLNEA